LSLAADVRHYLSQSPRQLPSRALYDALGSALFDAICELPWYPLTRAERRLIQMHRDAIFKQAALPSRLVELGPGNGSKLDLLLGEGSASHHVRRIDLIDVSAAALRDAKRRLREDRSATIVTHEARYEDGLARVAGRNVGDERTMVLFLGSNIGNFDPEGAATFLKVIRQALRDGDSVLMGVDLVKPERQLLLAYDDPLGVTAAFNKNLLVHLNRTLNANFAVEGFEHRAVWNGTASRIEMHLVSRHTQRIDVPAAGLSFVLGSGELIWTESSYKYTEATVEGLLQNASLKATTQWLDEDSRFLLVLATPV
jgi:dimethylhistidine N-methyltransferase